MGVDCAYHVQWRNDAMALSMAAAIVCAKNAKRCDGGHYILEKCMFKFCALLLVLAFVTTAAAPLRLLNYAPEFDRFEESTRSLPPVARVKAFHEKFDRLLPGMYADEDQAGMDRKIANALEDFPKIRDAYRRTEQRFPGELDTAVAHFRKFFPDFEPPYPIYLLHDVGQRDGGTTTVNGQHVMLFGADMIARIHDDDSVQPFLEHELFHLEHARHFADCDQYWCQLWKEGLAVYAASVMTPGADDHQLLLDLPKPIRGPVDANMAGALCFVSANFDSDLPAPQKQSFMGGEHPPELPSRFGYYIGLLTAQKAMRDHDFASVARMNNDAARPVVRAALVELINDAKAGCAPPAETSEVTYKTPMSS